MSAAAGHLARVLVFIAIGVAVSLAVTLPQRASATANPVISYVQRGLLDSDKCSNYRDSDPPWDDYWIPQSHPCWHDDEPGDTRAIDYVMESGPPAPAGHSVFFHYRGDSQLFKFLNIPYSTPCTGVAAQLYWLQVGDGYKRGTINYLHIDVAGGVVGKIASNFEWLGTVSYSNSPSCWTGPHLHQSAGGTGNKFYFNRWENPWRDYYHEHTIYWPALQSDADSDSYGDNVELRLSTDPLDACPDTTTQWDEEGFDYFEPISPWPPDFNDNRVINIVDVLALKAPFGSSAGDPQYEARKDLNGDGTIDIVDVLALKPVFGQTCTP